MVSVRWGHLPYCSNKHGMSVRLVDFAGAVVFETLDLSLPNSSLWGHLKRTCIWQ